MGGVSAHLALPLRGPLGLLVQSPPLLGPPLFPETPDLPGAEEDYDAVDEDYPEEDYDVVEGRGIPVGGDGNPSEDGVAGGPYPPEASDPKPNLPDDLRRDPNASKRPRNRHNSGNRRRRPKNVSCCFWCLAFFLTLMCLRCQFLSLDPLTLATNFCTCFGNLELILASPNCTSLFKPILSSMMTITDKYCLQSCV